jgi:PAS domain S-box-containing protein
MRPNDDGRPEPDGGDPAGAAGAAPTDNELHRLCAESAPYGILIHDLEGRILLFNRPLEAITGYARSEIADIAAWCERMYPDPAYRALVAREGAARLSEKGVRVREAMITSRDGRKRLCRFNSILLPQPRLRLVYIRDIHEPAAAAGASFPAHPLADGLPSESMSPSFTWQRADGEYRLAGYNRAAEKLAGPGLSACLAESAAVLYGARPDLVEDLRRCFAAQGVIRRRCTHGFGHVETPGTYEATFRFLPPDSVILRLEDLSELRRAEDRLHESERKFTEFADLLPEIVFETDAEGRILFVNRSGMSIMGVDAANPQTAPNAFAFIHPDEQARAAENFRRAASGEDIGLNEYRLLRANGAEFPALIRSNPILRDGKPAGLRGFILDITERKRAEEALRASEAKFSLAFRAGAVGFVITTFDGGRVVDANPAYCRLMGFAREELIGRSVSELRCWADPADARRLRRLLEEHGATQNFEYRFRRQDGEIRIGRLSASLIALEGERCIFSEAVDFTDMNQMVEQLRASEQRFSRAFHAGAGAFAIVTLETGRFVDINAGVCEMTGYSREQLLGQSIYRIKIWADPRDRRRLVRRLLAEGVVRNFDFRFRRKSGERRTGLISAALIELGGERCMISGAVDLTERHEAEEALIRARDELERRVKERTADLMKVNRKLEQQIAHRERVEKDLRQKEKQLKRKTADLLEVNAALKVLLRRREEDRREVAERIRAHLGELVMPYIEKLRRTAVSPKHKAHLGIIERNLRDLAAPRTRGITDKLQNLTPSEIQVANLIRLDKSSKEIAGILNVSVKTVEYHRYSLRRKLGLIKKPVNLRAFLKALK